MPLPGSPSSSSCYVDGCQVPRPGGAGADRQQPAIRVVFGPAPKRSSYLCAWGTDHTRLRSVGIRTRTGRSEGRAHDRGPDTADRQAPCRATDALGVRERAVGSVLRTTEYRCLPLRTCRETRARPVVGAPVAPMAGPPAARAGRGGRDARRAAAPEWRIACENFHKLPARIGLPPPAPRARAWGEGHRAILRPSGTPAGRPGRAPEA